MRQTVDPADPTNTCWGCSPHNPTGLQLRFEPFEETGMRAAYVAPASQCGREHTVHGGIQSALLDEVMGAALGRVVPPPRPCATAELQIRFRRPVPTDHPLVVEATVSSQEPPWYGVEGRLLDLDGTVLTIATSRWKVLDEG